KVRSYTELSPSGKGIRILARGNKPDGRCRKGNFECYNVGRYLTLTGHHLDGTPGRLLRRPRAVAAVCDRMFAEAKTYESNGVGPSTSSTISNLSDDEIICRARNAKNGAKFSRLWSGDCSAYKSASEADQALISLLAFWTGADPVRLDQLFR